MRQVFVLVGSAGRLAGAAGQAAGRAAGPAPGDPTMKLGQSYSKKVESVCSTSIGQVSLLLVTNMWINI